MTITEKKLLFTSLTVEESATVCGGAILVVFKQQGVNNFLNKTESDLVDEARRLGLNPNIVQDIKKQVLASR